ncbi:ABC-2 type transport system ATP-binding protein [Priestia taiwanensis]|uniref:ABC transporter ATP-binding protein n=2 Tax=Priestia taiwanensis TaxID=1347902 RepID=A0A917ARA1_9BACI|nr:ABC-2 type transport system ATP-binding protein [Priestia taiwanensis]GGE68198.1 ABC transporter ATP-binding protein [Priestia taiwanensis]
MRHLLGFMKAQSGKATINNLDCWSDATAIKNYIGYLPGEIAFIEGMTGKSFLHMLQDLRGDGNTTIQQRLVERFEFDPTTPIRKMSKGMKQKVAIVAAFMHDPAIYILDEPTSGLDPLMQQRFVELILEEKERGKTILMSSHYFQEMERTCDRAAMIKDGEIIITNDMEALRKEQKQRLLITVQTEHDMNTLLTLPHIKKINKQTVEITVQNNINDILKQLAHVHVTSLHMAETELEELFMHYYQKEGVK